MKFNKLTLCLITFGLFAGQINARIPGRGASGAAIGDGTSVDISNPSIGVDGTVVSAGRSENCDPRDTGGYVSMNFLRNIVDPSVSSPNEVKVVEVSDGNYQVQLGKHITACTDLQFEVTKANHNYFIRVKNNFEFTPENVPVKDGEKFENLSFDEKYYRCVEGKGLLKNGNFDRIKAEQTGNISYGLNSNAFALDLGDGKKSITAFFGSPKATAYGTAYKADNVNPKPAGWNCVSYENFGEEENRLFTSRRDRVYDRALGVCEKENAEEILEELSRLRSSSAGNFRDLERILEGAYEEAKNKRVKEIYDEMDRIEKAMKPDSKGEMVSESVAADYAKEYSSLAKELSRIVIQPATRKVNELLEQRTPENKDAIDAKVKQLNDQVQEFSKRDFNSLEHMYDVLKEYNLTKEARDIEGLRLASHHYGRVYKDDKEQGRGKALSLDDATERVRDKINDFEDKVLSDWTAQYEVKRGNRRVVTSARREFEERTRSHKRLIQRLVKKEEDAYRKACGYSMPPFQKNPMACKRWHENKDRRARSIQAQLNRSSRGLTSSKSKYFSYSRMFSDYEAQLEESNDYEPFSYYGADNYDFNYEGDSNYEFDPSWQFQMMPQQGMRGPAQQGLYAPGFNSGMGPMMMGPMNPMMMGPATSPMRGF